MNSYKRVLFFIFLFSYSFSHAQQTAPAQKGNAFNPDISANFLGLLQRGTGIPDDRTQSPHNGLSLQEAELQLTSDVDPYLKASVLASVAQEAGSAEYGIDPEEVYLETISLPVVAVRAGKFKLALGKHNQLHTHAFPFIDAPRINQILLGDEGLNESAVSASVLIPANWYSEVIVQGFSLTNENLFNSKSSGETGGLVRLKNLWDLTDDLTLELGLSGASGKNEFAQISSILGSDLTFKWRPAAGGKYHALVWSTEYLQGTHLGSTDATSGETTEKLGGIASWVQYQFAERWWAQGRFEYVGIPRDEAIPFEQKQSALIGFFPSEFSGIRLQYDHSRIQSVEKDDQTIALQYNVSIGAHPAHAY